MYLKWSVIASIAGLAFNVVADPIVGYFYKQYILGQPQELAQALAKMSAAATFHQCSCIRDPGSDHLQRSTSGTDQEPSDHHY